MKKIKVFDEFDQIKNLQGDWTALGALFPNPLLQFEWFITCAETLYGAGELFVIAIFDGRRVVGIAPLAKIKRRRSIWLEIMGSNRLYEVSGFLYENEKVLWEIQQFIGRLRFPLDLGRLPAASPLLKQVPWRAGSRGMWIRRPVSNSCALSLESGWEEIWRNMSKSRRTDFRRLRRRAAEKGCFSLEALAPSPEELESTLKIAVEIEGGGWKGSEGNSLKNDSCLENFFLRYCRRMADLRTLYIFYLRLGEKRVAMHLAVEYANALWIIKIGYDEKIRNLSPGLFLTLETIRFAAEKGFSRYEFLGSEESWQHAWPVERQKHGTLIFIPWSLRGLMGVMDIMKWL